jgi:hypothetical protein
MIIHRYPLIYTCDSMSGFKGIPNATGYFRRPSINKEIRLNNFGFYGPNFSADHPDSIFRIIIYGTSDVEGVWSDTTASFPELLDKKLKAANVKAEIINCAVSGIWRGRQTISLIRATAARFHANLVLLEQRIPFWSANVCRESLDNHLVAVAGNDPQELQHAVWVAKTQIDLVKRHKLVTDIYDLFYLARYVTRRAEGPAWGSIVHCWGEYALGYPHCWQYLAVQKDSMQQSIATLNNLDSTLNAANCKLLLFSYGDEKAENNPNEYENLQAPRIYLNVPLNKKEFHLPLDEHPNYKGKNLIAGRLFSALTRTYIPLQFAPLPNSACR